MLFTARESEPQDSWVQVQRGGLPRLIVLVPSTLEWISLSNYQQPILPNKCHPWQFKVFYISQLQIIFYLIVADLILISYKVLSSQKDHTIHIGVLVGFFHLASTEIIFWFSLMMNSDRQDFEIMADRWQSTVIWRFATAAESL